MKDKSSEFSSEGRSVCRKVSGPRRACFPAVVAWLAIAFFAVALRAQTLTIQKVGSGRVWSDPSGIDCGSDCVATFSPIGRFPVGVNLFVEAAPGWSFVGWSGHPDCGRQQVWVSGDMACSAAFAQESWHLLKLTRTGEGSGTVWASAGGLDCGARCAATFPAGITLSLGARPEGSSVFREWKGDQDCRDGEVTMGADLECEAVFDPPVPGVFGLRVLKTGNGTGTVWSRPAGIHCGDDCDEEYPQGSTVELVAEASSGAEFLGWSGAADCVVGRLSMTAGRECVASFAIPAPSRHSLVVRRTGAGDGTVVSTPAGIACGTVCASSFAEGTRVALGAVPAPGWRFSGWSGGGCSGVGDCSVSLDEALTVGAEFSRGGRTDRIPTGDQGNFGITPPALSADGSVVAFSSVAGDLVPDDSNGVQDIFTWERFSGRISRVSVAPDGSQANGASLGVSISYDGRWIAFASGATNLVPGDSNQALDVFVHDRATGTTRRISVASDGSEARSQSYYPSISADGQVVAFQSLARTLVAGDTNGEMDCFTHDLRSGETRRVSVATGNQQSMGACGSPVISGDGKVVAFVSKAGDLVAGDTNYSSSPYDDRGRDVFVHELASGTTSRVSVATGGGQADFDAWGPSMSFDGRFVSFFSGATNLAPEDENGTEDVFVHDRQVGVTTLESRGTGGSPLGGGGYDFREGVWQGNPQLSSDGRHLVFQTYEGVASDDTNGTNDIYLRDRLLNETMRVSVASGGGQANGHVFHPVLSADGNVVAFDSFASNLYPDDTNGRGDAFVNDRQSGARGCIASPSVACLQGGRFEVKVGWETASEVGDGEVMAFGGARTESTDSVFFTFFGPTNFEMGLKVLDACVPELGNKYWVFISGLTDQGWTVSVRDSVTGRAQTYGNTRGTLSRTWRDSTTFDCSTSAATSAEASQHGRFELESVGGLGAGSLPKGWEASLPGREGGLESEIAADILSLAAAASGEETTRDERFSLQSTEAGEWRLAERTGTCVRTATTACLQNGRFEVNVGWQTSSGSGAAEVMSFAGQRTENVDSVFYTFFSPTNFEMGLKVLDACVPALGNKYWVFVSGLTDQGWTVTVRDTVTGQTRTYVNPVGTLSQSFLDAASFSCEPRL